MSADYSKQLAEIRERLALMNIDELRATIDVMSHVGNRNIRNQAFKASCAYALKNMVSAESGLSLPLEVYLALPQMLQDEANSRL
ncbi:hypothetical protein [Spirosoma sp. 209]|uniref:hypothetical protein n=1 Tax=Spirosoma sp. 209 TaxID=1955701 RepID=UPI00098D5691|nr:hypothetical protein [Spirosoma sp. 209]